MSIAYTSIDECKLSFDDKMDSDRRRSGRRFEVNAAAVWIFLGVMGVILLIVIIVLLSHNYMAVSFLSSHQQKSNENDPLASMMTVLQEFKNLTQKNKEKNIEGFCSSSGWIEMNRECYYISPRGISKTWTASKRDCESRGGRLATIKSRSKLEVLSLFHYNAWIGLSDREAEGTWVWVDGTDLKAKFWMEGEPNDADENEDCAHLNVISAEIGFNDNDCESVFPYICETLE